MKMDGPHRVCLGMREWHTGKKWVMCTVSISFIPKSHHSAILLLTLACSINRGHRWLSSPYNGWVYFALCSKWLHNLIYDVRLDQRKFPWKTANFNAAGTCSGLQSGRQAIIQMTHIMWRHFLFFLHGSCQGNSWLLLSFICIVLHNQVVWL